MTTQMKKWSYYNDSDPKVCAWARELIKAGLVADGEVDCRSITEVRPEDLDGFAQCHFFSGICGWSYALRLAGIPDEYPVWTGSAPCQPFSAAGKQLGTADERHLWPVFFRLIAECRPGIIFGEQVASSKVLGKAGRKPATEIEPVWIDGVFADLESIHYTCGAADIPAAGVSSPHIRQRLYWMAHAGSQRRQQVTGSALGDEGQDGRKPHAGIGMEHAEGDGREQRGAESGGRGASSGCGAGRLEHADVEGRAGQPLGQLGASGESYWSAFELIHCLDGKSRRIEPGTFPLVAGLPRGVVPGGDPSIAPQATAEGRVARLRGYGNSIVPQIAAQFILASLHAIQKIT